MIDQPHNSSWGRFAAGHFPEKPAGYKPAPRAIVCHANAMYIGLFGAIAIAVMFAAAARADQIEFNRDIRPILSENCYRCHGPDEKKRKAELRLDSQKGAFADLGDYAAIVAGQPDKSELLKRVLHKDPEEHMPPAASGKKLSAAQIALLRQWIQQGAPYQQHWAFVTPRRPQVPKISKPAAAHNPIDHFVVRRLEARKLTPSPEADRRTLIRRVSFDLTGLPPSPDQVKAFVGDQRKNAYERLIDRLLASPHYGEQMAQHWLDAARYADTTGFAADKARTMWLYRDWVIKALNDNMPFDQFTIEQLAGDMLSKATQSQKIATGFHRNSMQALGNNPRKEEFRVKGIIDRLDTTGRVWLGLTLSCAECHDHKYDPVTQREYYQIFAIFNNIPHLGKTFAIHGPRLKVKVPGHGNVDAQVMEEMATPRKTHIHVRGNFENLGALVSPGIPTSLGNLPKGTAANRLSFARWLVDGKNPLVARVIVNRLWQQFFGMGIVHTVEDFGAQGGWPSHPELLDWLAVELVESGWDMRRLCKLIVMSGTYRQSSKVTDVLLTTDYYNRLLARGPRHRLSAEQIRDNMLVISGLLNRKIGGPSVYPVQPSHIGEFRDATAGKWQTGRGDDRYRRGLYTYWQRMYPYPSMSIFDAPSRERCTVRRSRSNTPLQALVTLNDPVFFEAARAFARRIIGEAKQPTDVARLQFAFETTLARSPSKEESRLFLAFYKTQHERFKTDPKSAASVAAGQPAPHFELAAWTMIASTLLNLDETISKQ
jgi:mono/diheme cytochrome c family protein